VVGDYRAGLADAGLEDENDSGEGAGAPDKMRTQKSLKSWIKSGGSTPSTPTSEGGPSIPRIKLTANSYGKQKLRTSKPGACGFSKFILAQGSIPVPPY
jgi:hypothetical protein